MNTRNINPAEIVIRPFHLDDAPGQYTMVSDPRVVSQLLQLPSMELSETEKWAASEQSGRHRLVADWQGRVVGFTHVTAYLTPRLRHCGRLGLMVHPDVWGQGVGSQLMTAALDLADNWLNLSRVELEVYTHNEAAIHLYEKFGFVREGLRQKVSFGNGRFLDDFVMARLHGRVPGPVEPNSPATPPPPADFTPEEVLIRPPRRADFDDLHACLTHPLVDRTTLQLPSMEVSQIQKRFGDAAPGIHRFAAEVQGKAVGLITLHKAQNPRQSHVAGMGMMVHPAYWGKGIGNQLMAAIIDLADNWLNVKRLELEVNTDNPAAVRLYEKFGFVIEGTKRWHAFGDGRLADSHFMGRIR
ncbi:MAG: GNAT family N-acetyltransferase [Ardenticatenaceae bacterium]|nr:GNAT family N-acetyltransferase [Ardenticatenaceae bacterium]